MASSGNWLTDTWSRITNGVNPIQAIFTPSPSSDTRLQNVYPNLSAPQAMQQLGADSAAQTAPNLTGAGVYGAGGGGSYDANTDPGLVGQARGQVSPLIAQLRDLYGQLNTQIDAYGQDKRAQIDLNYNTGLTNNTNSFNRAYNQTNGIMTARGVGDSSYLGNAQQENKNALAADNTNLANSYNQNLEQLGGIIASNKAAVKDVPQYDLNAYTDVNSLLSLRDALDSHIQGLNSQKTNLLTGGQLKAQLDSIAPGTSNLDATLKARIDSLAGSGAPPEAAFGLGQGYIDTSNLSKADKEKWTTYLSTVLSGSRPTKAA